MACAFLLPTENERNVAMGYWLQFCVKSQCGFMVQPSSHGSAAMIHHPLGVYIPKGRCSNYSVRNRMSSHFSALLCRFLRGLQDNGLSFPTMEVYLAATLACHVGFDSVTAGVHPFAVVF